MIAVGGFSSLRYLLQVVDTTEATPLEKFLGNVTPNFLMTKVGSISYRL